MEEPEAKVEEEVEAEEKEEPKPVEAAETEEVVAEEEEPVDETEKPATPEPPDEFNWDALGKKQEFYSDTERTRLEDLYANTLKPDY